MYMHYRANFAIIVKVLFFSNFRLLKLFIFWQHTFRTSDKLLLVISRYWIFTTYLFRLFPIYHQNLQEVEKEKTDISLLSDIRPESPKFYEIPPAFLPFVRYCVLLIMGLINYHNHLIIKIYFLLAKWP